MLENTSSRKGTTFFWLITVLILLSWLRKGTKETSLAKSPTTPQTHSLTGIIMPRVS